MNFTGKYPEFLRLKGTGYAVRGLGEHYVMVSLYRLLLLCVCISDSLDNTESIRRMIVYFSCHNYHAKLNINSIACSYSDVPPPPPRRACPVV